MRRFRRTEGLTLVELLVALVFVGVVFSALALTQITGLEATRNSQERTAARDIGSRVLEEIRALGYLNFRDCDPGSTATGPLGMACSGTRTPAGQPLFEVSWRVTNEPPGLPVLSPPAVLGAEVVVTWQDERLPLFTYLSCGDPGDASLSTDPCPSGSMLGSP